MNKMKKYFIILGIVFITSNCTVYTTAPPPKRVEVKIVRPHGKAVWVEGHWKWKRWKHRHEWVPGHWAVKGYGARKSPPPYVVKVKPHRPHRHSKWVPGHWKWHKGHGHYVWVPGHWKVKKKHKHKW